MKRLILSSMPPSVVDPNSNKEYDPYEVTDLLQEKKESTRRNRNINEYTLVDKLLAARISGLGHYTYSKQSI